MRQIRILKLLDRCEHPPYLVIRGWRLERAVLFAHYYRYVYDHEGD